MILGMGNPIRSDDGVGLHFARALEGRLPGSEVHTTSMIGLDLLDLVAGYERVIVIDAIQTGSNRPGAVEKSKAGEGTLHLFSSHGFHFFEIIQLGRELGYQMPHEVGVYGIEIGDECPFGEALSPVLMARKEEILQEIAKDVSGRIMLATRDSLSA